MQKVIYEVIILEETQHFKVIKINNQEIFSIVKHREYTEYTCTDKHIMEVYIILNAHSYLQPIPIKPPITIRVVQPSFCFLTRILYQFRLQKPRKSLYQILNNQRNTIQFPKLF